MSIRKINIKQNSRSRRACVLASVMLLCLAMVSCKKLVDIPPPTQSLAQNSVYATDATAIGVLTGLYASLSNGGGGYPFQGLMSIGLLSGLSADELSPVGTNNPYYAYYTNSLSGITTLGSEQWTALYSYIYRVNAAIEGLQNSNTLTLAIKQQLLGEAQFMRAFFYFYLVNLFGDVPLAISTDAQANSLLARTPKADVYKQIIADLISAKGSLNSNYVDITLLKTTTERVRPTQWAAEALLARVYLYTGDFADAVTEATAVINNVTLYSILPNLNGVFLKNSKEAIWQIQPTTNDLNTLEGNMYVIPPSGPSIYTNPVFLSQFLLNSFEPGDKRAVLGNWVNTTIYMNTSTTYDTVPYMFKYKIYASPGVASAGAMSEYFMVLRLAELYLIKAEAEANGAGGGTSAAIIDLNSIRNRAGLPNTTASTKDDLLTAILNERRHEMFCEWGHRWLDLKRTGKVDAVMSTITPLKTGGAPWQSYQQLYPISKFELNKAPNLTQNNGY